MDEATHANEEPGIEKRTSKKERFAPAVSDSLLVASGGEPSFLTCSLLACYLFPEPKPLKNSSPTPCPSQLTNKNRFPLRREFPL